KENSEEELNEENFEHSEDLLNEENESDMIIEDENELDMIIEDENESDMIIEDENESEGLLSDDIAKEKLEMDNIEPANEILGENNEIEATESEVVDEESLEEQMREFHKNLIEASLYAAGRPLTIEELSNKLEFPKKEVEELINEVAFDYLDRSTALIIAQIGERYQMQIKPEYTERVSKFAKGGAIAERYLRTLTVIALKQPILKSVVIKIRGSGAYEHVKYLIDNGFVDAIKKGRSHELTTTDKYADMFGLPKDKHLLKQAMVSQLGIEEGSINEQPEENQEKDEIEQE
ncbi:MAG: SMC-Scp complex subunit ScpB, partial [Candidatus Thorarchaeota archaeon]